MIICENDLCTGCMSCMNICGENAIIPKKDDQGFIRPLIDYEKCKKCMRCVKTCPVNRTSGKRGHFFNTQVYAAWTKDDDLRKKGTSGGIATGLAKSIIEQNGVVWGAAYTDNFKVQHVCIDDFESLKDLTGTKYVQSDIGEAYRNIQEQLKRNIKVLFIGTPCQVSGLQSFLRNAGCGTTNLLTVDILCHGVPSPLIFTNYVNYIEKKYNKKIRKINQRGKKKSWFTYSI